MTQSERVKESICSDLLSGVLHPGDSVRSEREMAEALSVSRVTVRCAYEELADSGILKKFRGKAGTRIATDFQGHAGTSPLVAVLATLDDRFSRNFIEALQSQSLTHGLLTVLAVTPEHSAQQSEMALRMVSRGIGNLVIWGIDRNLDFALFERMRILGVNQVFFDRVKPHGDFADYVALDNVHAMKSLLESAGRSGPVRSLLGIDAADLAVDSNADRREALSRLAARCSIALEWRTLPWRDASEDARLLAGLDDHVPVFTVNDDLALRVRRCYPAESLRIFSIDGTSEAKEQRIVSYRQNIDRMAEKVIGALLKQRKASGTWQAASVRVRGEVIEC